MRHIKLVLILPSFVVNSTSSKKIPLFTLLFQKLGEKTLTAKSKSYSQLFLLIAVTFIALPFGFFSPLMATSNALKPFYKISFSALTLMTLTNIFATLSIPLFSNTTKIFSRQFRHHLGNRLNLPKLITHNQMKQALFLCNFLAFPTSTGT